MAALGVYSDLLAIKLPAIPHFKGLVDNRNHCSQFSVKTQRKKEEQINQPIRTQESDHRRNRNKVSSSTKRKPPALLPLREWEEQRKQYQDNIRQRMMMEAKSTLDTKAPKTFPHIRENWKRVQLQEERRLYLENQRLQQRIQKAKSDFRRELWKDDWEKNLQWRNNITRFPRRETNKQSDPNSLYKAEPISSSFSRLSTHSGCSRCSS